MKVTAWIEKISIPTYKTGEPEKNPMFMEKRVYQGSSGVVYPHPVIELIADEKTEQVYTAVFLENDYLKIMILPELGGRIQRAYDKVQQRDFVYYNQVVKPALVGLAGPWISGGIEFNWPQHHRPSTFSPIDFAIEENKDGSKTVWVNEIEVMFRTKGRAGFTLFEDKAYLEIKGKLFNRTAFPQSFLWWANPAVKVNEHYQSVFPPDVYAVFDHGKRDVSDFPIATGTYYKVDYSPGTDISRYDTIPVPTSYMAIRSNYDFMGCYEHDTQAGMLHVADHHLSPGKKQWTWGNGEFGFAWDRNLTDEDGPYIELMTGVFTDNQPDFSWLQPNEEKTFEQYFMPYARIGVVKNATKEAMLNLETEGNHIHLKVYATSVYENANIELWYNGELLKEYTANISPNAIFEEIYDAGEKLIADQLQMVVSDSQRRELVAYRPEKNEDKEIPLPASAALPPAEIEQIEDLYLNGLHLEQYRHATYNPIDYYEEGLKRSPGDIRCNNAMGLLLLRRGQFKKAEPYFRTAIQTLTRRNPNPYDGEPYYNLGLSLKLQGRFDEAYDAFFKATWNDAFQHSGFLSLAQIASLKSKWVDALQLVEKSLVRNAHSHTARHLKAVLLRKNGQFAESLSFANDSLEIDLFNFGCLFEQYLVHQQLKGEEEAAEALLSLTNLMRDDLNNFLELSLDYAQAGLYAEAKKILTIYKAGKNNVSPLVYYYMAWFATGLGDDQEALALCKLGAIQSPDKCFPNKIEEIVILQNAMSLNPEDAKAPYYLGNLWYDKRQYTDAVACWELAESLDQFYPTVYRNLSLAYFNKLNDQDKALVAMEKAFSLDETDSRILMELDQLYKITGKSLQDRLCFLNKYPNLVAQRDDLYLEVITLYNNLQDFETARKLLSERKFHPWEGGEGKVVGQFLFSHISLAKKAIEGGDFNSALELLTTVENYPENLGEGKLHGTPENDVNYLLGCAYEGLGMTDKAREKFTDATKGNSKPVQAIYYNDPQPDKIFYQALAFRKLEAFDRADAIFKDFLEFAEAQKNVAVSIDYFAVSLPDMLVFEIDINKRNEIFCKYLIGLGYIGLRDYQLGEENLNSVMAMDKNHQGAANHLRMIPALQQRKGSYVGN